MTQGKTLEQRIDAILGRNCPALGGVSGEGIQIIRDLEQLQGELVEMLHETAEQLQFAAEKLGFCGYGEGGNHKAGTAGGILFGGTISRARATLNKVKGAA